MGGEGGGAVGDGLVDSTGLSRLRFAQPEEQAVSTRRGDEHGHRAEAPRVGGSHGSRSHRRRRSGPREDPAARASAACRRTRTSAGQGACPASRRRADDPLPAHDPGRPNRVVEEPPGQLHPQAGRRELRAASSRPPGRRPKAPGCPRSPNGRVQGPGQVALGLLAVGAARRPAPRARRRPAAAPLAGSSRPDIASCSDTAARRTSWASSAARAPSTRACSRSSRVALNVRYQHAAGPARTTTITTSRPSCGATGPARAAAESLARRHRPGRATVS